MNPAEHLKSAERQAKITSGQPVVFGIAVVAILIRLLTAARYGYFRDELYYLDCARHLAWGYVDQPPLIAFIAWFVRHTTGDSLYSVRLLPAVVAGATVWLAGRLAQVLGAHGFGQGIAAIATYRPRLFDFLSFAHNELIRATLVDCERAFAGAYHSIKQSEAVVMVRGTFRLRHPQ